MRNSKDEKIKRPEIARYVIPAMRSKPSKKCEDKMEYSKGQFTSEATNRQTYSLGKHEIFQRRYTNIDPGRVRLDSSSSSSNPKNTSDESCKDYDSSDFEESDSDSASMNNLKIRNETNEDNLNDHWKKGGRREWPIKNDHGIEIKNYETETNISNKFWMQQKYNSDLKSHSNQGLTSESYEKKFDRGLFYNSDSEAIIERGSVLKSAPNSDIIPHPGSSGPSTIHPDSSGPSTFHPDSSRSSVPDPVFSWPSVPDRVYSWPSVTVSNSSRPSIFQPVSSRPSVIDPNSTGPSVPDPVFSWPSVPDPVYSWPSVTDSNSSRSSIFKPVSSRPSVTDLKSSGPSVPDFSRISIFHPDSSRRSMPRSVSSQPLRPRPLPARIKVPRPLLFRPPVSGYASS